ncbi:CsgG/HfaB family protein [Massilia horti]|uniref:Peptidoglycan-binding protein n=1 Tax=Massilia horti TaxID=2562153 RepID=A0A4Y9SSG2_9BURK|nr:CsgG/HfaB family protein [Massilia horti]TFW28279.1 peptidoglycan-binding protein [Massilia horti]
MNAARYPALTLLPLLLSLAACAGTTPSMGASSAKTVATGAAGGANAVGANDQLERCDRSLGTLTIVEDANQPWVHQFTVEYRMQSTVPLLRMIIQQSNCFVVVERGQAMAQMQGERELMQSGELRRTSKMGKGQMVAADYTVTPSITFSQQGTGGAGALFGGKIGAVASLLGGSMKSNEASTILLLTDNRSGIQLAAAEGSAKNWDFGLMGGFFQNNLAGVNGFSNTPQGKVLAASFMDSYNQMVKAVRAYKAQDVAGGLGNGGLLRTN